MSAEQLAAILEKGDQKACMEFFRDMPEKERRGFSRQALAIHKRENRVVRLDHLGLGSYGFTKSYYAAAIAVYASCTFAEIRTTRSFMSDEELDAVLLNRRPEWLDAWAAWFCESEPIRWHYLRRLINDGLCSKPMTDHYTLGMIVGLSPYHETQRTIYQALVADPELLQDDLWRIFEVEGDKDLTLAARDKFSGAGNTWSSALLRLAEEGRVSRARLLDATLGALQRDFKQFRAGWFSRFHEALKPTMDERAERVDAYLALLGSKIPPTVSFALAAILQIDGAKGLDDEKTLAALRPVLWGKSRGAVKAALGLVALISERSPHLRDEASLIGLNGLQHESPDVQLYVLTFVEKLAGRLSPELAMALRDQERVVAPSLRSRLAAILLAASCPAISECRTHSQPDIKKTLRRATKLETKWASLVGIDSMVAMFRGKSDTIPAVCYSPMEVPHLDPDRALERITDVDELIDAFARVLENQGDSMEVERVLDGVARLCARKPQDFAARTGPLAKRARQRMVCGPFVGVDILNDLCGLAIAWSTGEVLMPRRLKPNIGGADQIWYELNPKHEHDQFYVPSRPTLMRFWSLRMLSLARRVAADEPGSLLSAPTHAGGWIDPHVLVCRSREIKTQKLDIYDQVLALLRLAPHHRADALKSAKPGNEEWGQALRYSLGAQEKAKIGPTAALWIAAARARAPYADDPLVEARHPKLGPDAGLAAHYATSVESMESLKYLRIDAGVMPDIKTRVEFPTVLFHSAGRRHRFAFEEPEHVGTAELRWNMTIWPLQRQPVFAAGSRALAHNLDWWEAEWANKAYLEPLLDPDVPLEEMGYLLLALGLAAKEPGEHGLATDVLIAAIDDGRVDAEGLGAILAQLLPTKLIKTARWAKTLAQAARLSSLHALTIARAIQRALRGNPAEAPRDLASLLELLRELLAEIGQPLSDPQAREYLKSSRLGGKGAKLAGELLALTGTSSVETLQAAAARALEHRLQRAERWQRIANGKAGNR